MKAIIKNRFVSSNEQRCGARVARAALCLGVLLLAPLARADYYPVDQQYLTWTAAPEVLWSQDFSAGADGLGELPAQMTVENGHLTVYSPTVANTGVLVQGTRSLVIAGGMVFRYEVTPKAFGGSDIYIGVRDTLQTGAHYALIRNDRVYASYKSGGWHESELGPIEIDTTYKVEIEFTADGSSLFVYQAGLDRNAGYRHDLGHQDWKDIRTAIELYADSAASAARVDIDNIEERGKAAHYPIQSGDSWVSIAEQLYGTHDTADELAAEMGYQPLYAGEELVNPPALIKEVNHGSRIPFAVDDYVSLDEDSEVTVPVLDNDVVGMVAEIDRLQETNQSTGAFWIQDFSHDDSGIGLLPEQMQHNGGELTVVAPSAPRLAAAYGERMYPQSENVLFSGEITVRRDVATSQIGVGIRDADGHGHHYAAFFDGQIHAGYYDGGSQWTALGEFTLGTTYIVEVETGAQGTSLYVYEKGGVRAGGFQDTRNNGDWGDIRFYLLAEYWGNAQDDTLTLSHAGAAQNGTIAIDADGRSITYTPDENYNGPETIEYTAALLTGGSDTGIVHIDVNPVNDSPVAADDSYDLEQAVPLSLDVLDNDSDVDGDELTITAVTQPASGTVAIDVGARSLTFTPEDSGEYTFNYTVDDGNGGSATAAVGLTVPDPDRDGDGVPDVDDAFPDDPDEWADLDGDGIGDNADPDRDGDGVDNEADAFPDDPDEWADLDGDGIGDNADTDRDGDGTDNDQDAFPDDPARTQLPPVQSPSALLESEQERVRIQWQPPADPQNVAGYNVYRAAGVDGEPTLIADTALGNTEYLDTEIDNGALYQYRVIAVTGTGLEGEPAETDPLFVAYNNISVDGLTAGRDPVAVQLDWQSAGGVDGYRVFRVDVNQSLADVESNSYRDDTAQWDVSYGYRLATLLDFTRPDDGATVTVEGPPSDPVTVDALPALALSLAGAAPAADGVLEQVVPGDSEIVFTGTYENAVGPVEITAETGDSVFTVAGADGGFRMVIPATASGTLWTLTARETTAAERQAALTVRIARDEVGPAITLDNPSQSEVDAETVTVSGTITDDSGEIAAARVESGRFPETPFAVILQGDNRFSADVALQFGDNALTVMAEDGAGNTGQAALSVTRRVGPEPEVRIDAPEHGAIVETDAISLSGRLYTSLAPDGIRLLLGDRVQFPESGPFEGVYDFQFDNVRLQPGVNNLNLRAETTAGNADATVSVVYRDRPLETDEPDGPVIQITHPNLNHHTRRETVAVTGFVAAAAGPVTLTIDGTPVDLIGPDDTQGYFQYPVDLAGLEGDITLTLEAGDGAGRSTERELTLTRDAQPPQITLNEAGLQEAPAVNPVVELPYPLAGQVNDDNLAGFSINGNPVTLTATAEAAVFEFDIALELPLNETRNAALEAWDRAGNRTTRELVFEADAQSAVEIIRPREGETLRLNGPEPTVEVVARLSVTDPGYQVSAVIDGGTPVAMPLDGNAATASVPVSLGETDHTLTITVTGADDQPVATTRGAFTTEDLDNIALALERTEPANNAEGVEPNTPVKLYFNRPIDPSLLQIDVRETVHGLTFETGRDANPGHFPTLDNAEPVEVHRAQEPVPGESGTLTGNTVAVFYPSRDFAYGADLYVTVDYDGETLERFAFKIRKIPTFLQGTVLDPASEAVGGLTVSLPELGLETVTGSTGSYAFGFGLPPDQALPPGRHEIVFNPGRRDPDFVEVRQWVTVQAGRLNRRGTTIVPFLNDSIPFRPIDSGQSRALLAGGELELDLSEARLVFPNGRDHGNVHVQLIAAGQYSHTPLQSVAPQWVFAFQPPAIGVNGPVEVVFNLPARQGSYAYLPTEPMYVVMVGLDPGSRQIVPVGVGWLADRQVTATLTELRRLDYLGYTIVPHDQSLLEDYVNGAIGLDTLINALENGAGL